MTGSPVSPSQRFRRDRPCPVCGGWDGARRGAGERCYGYLSDDRAYVHCTRDELAGGIEPTDAGTYAHRLEGACKCGRSHGGPTSGPILPRPRAARAAGPAATYIGEPLRHLIRDADGTVVAVHCRQTIREADGTVGKRLWWELPNGEKNLGGRDPRSLVYLAEKLSTYDPALPLVIVEGETAADAALRLGLQVLGTVSGAGTAKAPKSMTPGLAESIARRGFALIALWPDADDGGLAHMRAIRASLEHAHSARVRFLRWPDAPPHGDAAEYASSPGATGAAALALVDSEERREPLPSEYAYLDGRVMWNGGREPVELLNFAPRIVEQSRRDTGDETDDANAQPFASYTVSLPQAIGPARPFRIPPEDFDSGAWVANYLGADAVVAPGRGMRDRLAAALRSLSAPVSETVTHEHVGWCRAEPLFVLGSGGAIGPDGIVPAAVALDGPFAHYTIAPPPTGDVLRIAVRALLGMFDAAPPRLAVPLMLHAIGAPLEPPSGYTLHLTGTTGLGKTTLACLAVRAYAPTLEPHDVTTYSSTPNALGHLLAAARGLPFVIDDMAPDSAGDETRVRKEGSHVLRMVGNGAGRDRLRRDATFNPGARPRAALISTGELDPETRSVIARALLLPVRSGDVLTESPNGAGRTFARAAAARADCDGRSGLHASAVAGWVSWIAPRRAELERFARDERARLRGSVPSAHARTAETIGDLGARAEIILAYAVETGAVSATEAGELWASWWAALLEAAFEHGREMVDTPAHLRIRRALQAELIAGRVYVASMAGGCPHDGEAFGWRLIGSELRADWRPQGECIGWVRDDDESAGAAGDADLYLETHSFEERAKPLGVSVRSLLEELADAGLLHTSTEAGVRHFAVKVRGIAGRDRTRVHHFSRSFLTDVEDDAPPPPPTSLPSLRRPGDPPIGLDPVGSAGPRASGADSPTAGATVDAAAIPADWPAEYVAQLPATIALGESLGMTTAAATARAIAELTDELARAGRGSPADAPPAALLDAPVPAVGAPREPIRQTMTRSRPAPRAASTWYTNLATDGRSLIAADGASRELGVLGDAGELATAVRAMVPGREAIVWVHESAGAALELPAVLPAGAAERPATSGIPFVQRAADRGVSAETFGAAGWTILKSNGDAPVNLGFPGYLGDFAGTADAAELLASVERFRETLGLGFAFSGASTLHHLIGRRSSQRARAIGLSAPEPALTPEYAQTAYAVPAHTWARDLDDLERARSWVRAFDRSGSYLASWNGCVLSDGAWREKGPRPLARIAERDWPAGYFRVAVGPLARALAAEGLADPFARYGDDSGEAWLTTPLAHLAAVLSDDRGIALMILRSCESADKWRPLDTAAERVSAARASLEADATPASRYALDALKTGYAAAVAWLEYGPKPPKPLARPHWRRTILDQTVANTWRALAGARPRPFSITEIDTALFALDAADATPGGLRVGRELGAWRPKGGAVRMSEAIELLAAGGPRAVLRRLEEESNRG